MVFWNAIWNPYKTIERSRIASPTGSPAQRATNLEEVQQFLYDHFQMHPDVVYTIPLHALQQKEDTILTVHDNHTLIATIRYHFIGTYESTPIHLVDCFCVHPIWRGKGVGDYLLHELHHMMRSKPCALFLKEGRPLPIVSFYQGTYVYREIDKHHMNAPNVTMVSTETAYRIMQIHQQFRPFVMIYTVTESARWKLYRSGMHHVLACVQDTYQTLNIKQVHSHVTKQMGWITAWIESPGITDAIRDDASYQLSNDVFDMVWMNQIHTSNASNQWKPDGSFYWYTYQWVPTISIGQSYCLLQ